MLHWVVREKFSDVADALLRVDMLRFPDRSGALPKARGYFNGVNAENNLGQTTFEMALLTDQLEIARNCARARSFALPIAFAWNNIEKNLSEAARKEMQTIRFSKAATFAECRNALEPADFDRARLNGTGGLNYFGFRNFNWLPIKFLLQDSLYLRDNFDWNQARTSYSNADKAKIGVYSVLLLAVEDQEYDVIEHLARMGKKVTTFEKSKGFDGSTVVHAAVKRKDKRALETLFRFPQHRTILEAKNDVGKTATQLARSLGAHELAGMLEKKTCAVKLKDTNDVNEVEKLLDECIPDRNSRNSYACPVFLVSSLTHALIPCGHQLCEECLKTLEHRSGFGLKRRRCHVCTQTYLHQITEVMLQLKTTTTGILIINIMITLARRVERGFPGERYFTGRWSGKRVYQI
ncbi:unnamed protein product [Amoebophrya sp. A25]|nr:unnamed protein product [Amoebophrya sp. A25]|eukprot:GSA25T00005124001.1